MGTTPRLPNVWWLCNYLANKMIGNCQSLYLVKKIRRKILYISQITNIKIDTKQIISILYWWLSRTILFAIICLQGMLHTDIIKDQWPTNPLTHTFISLIYLANSTNLSLILSISRWISSLKTSWSIEKCAVNTINQIDSLVCNTRNL